MEPRVLILDEATSALDNESEHVVQVLAAKNCVLCDLLICGRVKPPAPCQCLNRNQKPRNVCPLNSALYEERKRVAQPAIPNNTERWKFVTYVERHVFMLQMY